MRRQIMNSSANPTATPETLLASIYGLNSRDPLPNMNKQYALLLDNFFPTSMGLMLRKGYKLYHNCYDPAHSNRLNFTRLFSYIPANESNRQSCLIAVGGDGFVQLSETPSTEPITRIDSAATNRQWQAVNFSNAAGNWLWCCCGDGVNKARVFDGTTWTILDDNSTPALSLSEEIYDVCIFKRRLWLVRKYSTTLYYLDVLAIAGTLDEETMKTFPIGSLWEKGGYIIKVMNLTLDGGDGSDDYLCVFSSEGQIAIYKGIDPNDVDNWEMVGIYNTSRPLGRNCFIKYGGDIIFMSEQGLVAVSSLIKANTVDKDKNESEDTTTRKLFKSDVIQPTWQTTINNLKELGKELGLSLQEIGDYCDLTLYPAQSMLICNFIYWYQLTEGAEKANFIQYVMNTETGAWCRFRDINCSGFVEHKGEIYCVGSRNLYKFWDGFSDNKRQIAGLLKTAYVYPSGRGTNSRITLIRPIIQSQSSQIKYKLLIDTDYIELGRLGYTRINQRGNSGIWDDSNWDEAVWDGRGLIVHQWATVNHRPGKAVSLRIRIIGVEQEIYLIGFDAICQTGGMI